MLSYIILLHYYIFFEGTTRYENMQTQYTEQAWEPAVGVGGGGGVRVGDRPPSWKNQRFLVIWRAFLLLFSIWRLFLLRFSPDGENRCSFMNDTYIYKGVQRIV